MRLISLVDFNDAWANDFHYEVSQIKTYLNHELLSSHHIGSTAISGIKAKPVIDILLVVCSINKIDNYNQIFFSHGYEAKGEFGIKGRRFFHKGALKRTHHVHIYQSGNIEIKRHTNFVDYMNTHPEVVKEYERLKVTLADKYKSEPDNYFLGKTAFLKEIDLKVKEWKNTT